MASGSTYQVTHIKLFKRNQSAVNADMFCEIIHNGPTLMKLCQPVLGIRFYLRHSVVTCNILYYCEDNF